MQEENHNCEMMVWPGQDLLSDLLISGSSILSWLE